MNAGGVLNTCKSNEALYLIFFGNEDFVTEWRTGAVSYTHLDVYKRQALYRKFRPQEFEDVKGQEHIVTTLKNQIKADRIGHALSLIHI